MIKFIVLIITIILVTLCINIDINEPNSKPNIIDISENNNIIEENIMAENTINENTVIENNIVSIPVKTEKPSNSSNTNIQNKTENSSNTNNNTNKDTGSFSSSKIPDNIYQKMLGKSIPTEYKDDIDLSTLRYLKVSYFGFDGKSHVGEIIVNSRLASDLLQIFKELYEIKYPIEKIKLIDEYNADDELSMSDNNTSCFCYRVVSGSKTLSNHAKGAAIDINPLYNPYVTKSSVSPANGSKYADRTIDNKYKIDKNDALYKIFIKHRLVLGW